MAEAEAEAYVDAIKLVQSQQDEHYVNQFCFTHMASNYAVLKLAIKPGEDELLELYTGHVAKHNTSLELSVFPNAGFDLFVPEEQKFTTDFHAQFIDLKVKAEMIYCDKNLQGIVETEDGEQVEVAGGSYSSAYYLYARSSLSKTPLMLANHVGIIDAGYRGSVLAAVRKLPTERSESPSNEYTVEKHTRLFQICHSSLCPVFVVLVSESELNQSERGEGGFGSTGAVGSAK
jgi:dUTP pyrophosphatase